MSVYIPVLAILLLAGLIAAMLLNNALKKARLRDLEERYERAVARAAERRRNMFIEQRTTMHNNAYKTALDISTAMTVVEYDASQINDEKMDPEQRKMINLILSGYPAPVEKRGYKYKGLPLNTRAGVPQSANILNKDDD